MIEKKFVDLFGNGSQIADINITEKEVILTYVLQILSQSGLADSYVFKGGTCIRKVYLGSTGRFSMDADFTARELIDPNDGIIELMEVFNKEYYGISFQLDVDDDKQYYMTNNDLSFTVEPTYSHSWNDSGSFKLQVSSREIPTLNTTIKPLLEQPYFKYLEFTPPSLRCFYTEEILAEKIRAAYQRTTARDLWDLYIFATKPYNRDLVRKIAIIKLWQARDTFDPNIFNAKLNEGEYNWTDLRSLVNKSIPIDEKLILSQTAKAFSFLAEMDEDEIELNRDAKGQKNNELHQKMIDDCRRIHEKITK